LEGGRNTGGDREKESRACRGRRFDVPARVPVGSAPAEAEEGEHGGHGTNGRWGNKNHKKSRKRGGGKKEPISVQGESSSRRSGRLYLGCPKKLGKGERGKADTEKRLDWQDRVHEKRGKGGRRRNLNAFTSRKKRI